MPSLLATYSALSAAATRAQVAAVLRSIANDRALGLLAVKTLGRHPEGSAVIVIPKNLEVLHGLAAETSADKTDVTKEALRCVANALLLKESGRNAWLSIKGGELCASVMLRESESEYTFLVSRILFLVTLKGSPFMRKAVEELDIIHTLCLRLDCTLAAYIAGQTLSKEALIDLLKVAFNFLLQYPRMVDEESDRANGKTPETKVMGDLWDDKFESLLSPLLRVFNNIPPTSPNPVMPPLTHAIHALINIPVSNYASKWFSPPSPPPEPALSTSPVRLSTSEQFHKAFSRLSMSKNSLPRRSSSRPPSSTASASTSPSSGTGSSDTLRHAYDLLDAFTAEYVPADPDDVSVRQKCAATDVQIEDTAIPLVVLITRLVGGDESAMKRMRSWLLPEDLVRSSPLEKREDLLGRCIRLMGSVYYPRLKDSIGEMMFQVCDADANTLTAQIGYGNAAGYLFNQGMLAPPPTNSTSGAGASGTGSNPEINPITGTTQSFQSSEPEMTDEEKEREAERLFVLFDRLERTGMVANPIRKAIQEGKLQFP
ncbi:hypothetical protein BOTBODRAFT_110519 [Botryobasidium botryosum FD-172 SS1]|uniref:Uncharacterized protein n=1 Tax=Botryobasidium botryosum (strain FD-172 SS1) TaxID=930990 RepID=A0A067MHA4_BOTB1|nr:hypothetical protein BOTBODRAFT_110519 [Botryobasidium botryosum FD-172 SS1]